MDCKIVQQNIDLFIDGMLSEDEQQQLLDHAASCASCQKALDDAMRLKNVLSSLGEIEPPQGLVMTSMKKAKKKKPLFAYISAATAVVVAAVALVVVLSPGLSKTETTQMTSEDKVLSKNTLAEADDMVSSECAEAGEMEAAAEDEAFYDATDDTASIQAIVRDSSPSVYSNEEDFIADEGSSYFKPVALPESAVLDNISVADESIVFTYIFDDGNAYVFEWLDALDENGLKDWLEQSYGDLSALGYDGSFYTVASEDTIDVYWDQDGDAFHVTMPAELDILTYCAAQFIQVEMTETE